MTHFRTIIESFCIALCLLAFRPEAGAQELERAPKQRSVRTSKQARKPAQGSEALQRQFENPSAEARPWTFWYWMFGAVSEEGIKADLEAMQRIGLGGAYLMPIKSTSQGPEFGGEAEQLSPVWWQRVRYAMEQADRLGLQLGMHICDGFALAGGPWITPRESMQKVVSADTVVLGGRIDLQLPQPEQFKGYYEDIAVLALPAKESDPKGTPRIACRNLAPDAAPKDTVTVDARGVIRAAAPCWIQYEYPQAVTCRNVEIILQGNNYQAHRLLVAVSDDGRKFRPVKQLVPARQGWQNTDQNSTHAIPPTTSRFFRFYWTPNGSEPGSEDMDAAKWRPTLKIKELKIHTLPRLNQWEGKAGLVWRIAPETTPEEIDQNDCIQHEEIIDLTDSVHGGRMVATLPAGTWRILRMGHTSTGHTNATGGGGRGLECDKFNAAAVAKQFDNWFGRVFHEIGPELARRVLKVMHVDSWECGSQNWSECFPEEFRSRRGYDLMPYLPLLAGIPVDNAATSERVLRDVRETIAELVADVFYTVLAEKAKAYGCLFSAECVAPTMVSDGMLHYREVDLPMGEFWLRSPTHDKPNDMLDAVSGAHIYGKRLIQAEGFTEVRGTWDETPAMLKTLLDRNYATGINKMVFHVNVHNPYMNRRPGMTLDGIGLFFQRDNTWWEHGGRGMVDYMTRCQTLLQYGTPVVDIAVFTGGEMPRRAMLPDRLVPSLPGIFGAARVESERIRKTNERQPLRVMPVGVVHSANMADPDKWVDPLRGYAYDSFNEDALLHLAKVRDGRLVLPGGASYGALVVPLPHPMNPEGVMGDGVEARIEQLREQGLFIPNLPWQEEDFATHGLARDVVLPTGTAWCHRRSETDNIDIYFVANQTDSARTFTASFRVTGRRPEIWNPMTGEIRRAVDWKAVGHRTDVPLQLDAGASLFVIFTHPTTDTCGKAPMTVATARPIVVKNWEVYFPELDRRVIRDELFDWSQEKDEHLRYYSGTAVYTGRFVTEDVPKHAGRRARGGRGARTVLRFSGLHDVASVHLNGKPCGTVWTAPYEVDVTEALRRGENTVVIEVSNSWANALTGADCGKAPFPGIWTNGKYRRADPSLLPAGLLDQPVLISIAPAAQSSRSHTTQNNL